MGWTPLPLAFPSRIGSLGQPRPESSSWFSRRRWSSRAANPHSALWLPSWTSRGSALAAARATPPNHLPGKGLVLSRASGARAGAASGVDRRAKMVFRCTQRLKQEEALWTVLEIQGIEPTNNDAGRALRLAVIQHKISRGVPSAKEAL